MQQVLNSGFKCILTWSTKWEFVKAEYFLPVRQEYMSGSHKTLSPILKTLFLIIKSITAIERAIFFRSKTLPIGFSTFVSINHSFLKPSMPARDNSANVLQILLVTEKLEGHLWLFKNWMREKFLTFRKIRHSIFTGKLRFELRDLSFCKS